MATDIRIALQELLDKSGADIDFLREALRVLTQELIELEVSRQIGAERHERSAERVTYRNGYRERAWDTRVGTIDLRIPKLRKGSYFPSLLQPRRRAEKALVAVIQEAYIHGVSTRKVDVAARVPETGEREGLGLDVGMNEDGPFWAAFQRSLVRRGLKDVLLVVGDAHEGVKEAIRSVFGGSSWQRCRVHFMRNVLSQV